MTTSLERSAHTLFLLDGEVVEESDLGSMPLLVGRVNPVDR